MENTDEFDFERWATLARENPEEFERQRKQMIDEIINNSPEMMQKRMQGIQWQIDQVRQTAKTPMAACIKISSMMWDRVLGENGLVEAIEQLDLDSNSLPKKQSEHAQILSFPSDSEDNTDLSSK